MKISLSDACFGPNVSIDGESLFMDEYDSRTDDEIRNLRLRLIDELVKIINDVDMSDLKVIAEIVVTRGIEFEYNESESHTSDCEQCGSYNTREVYDKKVIN